MRRGFTTLELILACSLLSLVSVVMFSIFRFGVEGFRKGSGRADLQAEGRSVMVHLKRDVELSTLAGSVIDASTARRSSFPPFHGNQPRRLCCLPALSDWNDPARFDIGTGLPLWDSYVLYHAGVVEGAAGLHRVEVLAPGGNGQSWSDFSLYSAGYLSEPPPQGTMVGAGRVRARRVLASHLLSFEASRSTKSLVFTLRLCNQAPNLAKGGAKRSELFEIQGRFRPKNLAI